MTPNTPKLELDANFSRILQKKREEQLEASKQRLFDSTSMANRSESLFETTTDVKKVENIASMPAAARKDHPVELDNSMMFNKVMNKSWNDLSGDEDSFLALERQCRMDDKKERLLNANDTLLFDVEPPSELWNQTVNQSLTIDALNHSQESSDDDEEETIEISPVKYVGLTRPSTIIEETSSQMESSSKNSSSSSTTNTATKSSLYATASTMNESSAMAATSKESSIKSCNTSLSKSQKASNESSLSLSSSSLSSSNLSKISPLGSQNLHTTTKADRQRRGTFAFKRANYTFFPNENLDPINESECLIDDDDVNNSKSMRVQHVETPKNLRSKTPIKAAEIQKKDLLDFNTPSSKCVAAVTTTPSTKSVTAEVDDTSTKGHNGGDDKDQFNNTLERVDFLLEKGKQILEETPISKRSRDTHHQSMFETPLFSCKRKRLLSEMASMEMLPLPKRGPLIDFSTPEVTNAKRVSKFAGK